ncbi:MAG: hypothetical protein EXR62_10790 [Chloroflexi bacterium]|nr:hypothetical protein [Chloroflexota bacterium]
MRKVQQQVPSFVQPIRLAIISFLLAVAILSTACAEQAIVATPTPLPIPPGQSARLPTATSVPTKQSPQPAASAGMANPQSSGNRQRNDPLAQIPRCPEISTPLFDTMPIAPKDFLAFRPLGWLSPPIHIFPAKHSSFTLSLPGETSPQVTLQFPGHAWVTEIWSTQFEGSSAIGYQLYFYPCREFRAYLFHLSAISDKLLAEFKKGDPQCQAFNDGNSLVQKCQQNVMVQVDSGEMAGLGSDASGVDFGATDERIPDEPFINPAHYPHDYMKYVSPVDYFTPAVKAQFTPKLASFDGKVPREAEPKTGSYMQDLPGKAQGNWFFPGISYQLYFPLS